MVDFIINYWWLIVIGFVIGFVAGHYIRKWFNKPTDEQIADLIEWLLYAVAIAEKKFGEKTGQLKLREVYDMFLTKFPHLVKFISFKQLSALVDVALEEFKKLRASNKQVENFVATD